MHDKNGKLIKKGDRVRLEGVISDCHATDEYCNVTIKVGYEADHGPHNVHSVVTLNARQTELIEPNDA